MLFWILSAIGVVLFLLLSFYKEFTQFPMQRVVQIVCLLMILALPLSILPRKFKNISLRNKIREVSNVTIDGQAGYVDVEQLLTLSEQLKCSQKGRRGKDQLRLAEMRLLHPPLDGAFYRLIENPPLWIEKAIDAQLAHFRSERPASVDLMIEEFQKLPDWQEQLLLAKYKIKDGRLYVKDYSMNHNKLQYMNAALNRLLHATEIPDLEFAISFHGSLNWINLIAPIFVHSKREGNPYIIVMPDHEILTGFDTLNVSIDKAVKESPWEEKKDIAFWRGSTTSGDYSLPNWRTFPRSKLVYMAQDNAHIDAKFSLYVQGAETNTELLAEAGLRGEFLDPEESLIYRYLIDVDGNHSTYSRFYWILRSNCVPLKQNSSFQMWFYPALKPFVHYIPYAEDLSDLSEVVKWAQTHPKESYEIADNGRQLMLNRLTTEHAYAYLYLLLIKYQELYSPTVE